jgi:hypothetical protein
MSDTEPKRHLLVFARLPIPGSVKTRLIPTLGEAGATAVYRRLLRDTLESCAHVSDVRRELWLDQAAADAELNETAARLGLSLHLQCGPDLGARMQQAFVDVFDRARSAVLIGSDCPEYDRDYIETAFQALQRHDAVLGPAADGGYVLIGLKRVETSLFENIPWGTARVLETTRKRLRRLRWTWLELDSRQDVDEPQDLLRFPYLTGDPTH